MPSWYLKAALQGGMSYLPDPQRWNRLFQRHVTKGLELTPTFFATKTAVVERHLENWRRCHPDEMPGRMLELGTGWYPVVPIGLALRTGGRVTTVDIQPLLGAVETGETLRMYADAIAARPDDFAPDAAERVRRAQSSADIDVADRLRIVGVDVRQEDIRSTSLESGSIDLITSNNTFEHIPAADLEAILRAFARLCKPDGVGSHLTDLADHYAGFDPSITVYNFLRYSDGEWQKYNNRLQYQNRLRWSEYRAIIDDAGWSLIDESVERDPGALAAVDVHERFERFDEDDLGVHTAWAVLTLRS